MKKKQKDAKKWKFTIKSYVCMAAGILVVAGIIMYGWSVEQRIKDLQERVGVASISHILLGALDAQSHPAPLDHMTGDVYFPEMRLRIPQKLVDPVKFVYSYDTNDNQPILRISNSQVLDGLKANLLASESVESAFNDLPRLQSCRRGISLAEQTISDDSYGSLRATIELENRKPLYAYIESSCELLDETLDLVKSIEAY